MRQIQDQAAYTNARALIDAIQENCFSKCISKPGNSLANAESTCYTQCMDKYLAAWNIVSHTLIRRAKEEGHTK